MKTIIWRGNVEKTSAPYGMYQVAYEYEDSAGRGFSRYVYDTYEDARDFANGSPYTCSVCRREVDMMTAFTDNHVCATCTRKAHRKATA